MMIAGELGRPQRTAVAAALVLLSAIGLSVAMFAWSEAGSKMLAGILVWIGWGLYPGFAAFLAIRARSEMAVTAVAVLAPALIQAPFNDPGQGAMTMLYIPLTIAVGIFAGMWAASALMRRPGRAQTLLGFVAGGVLGYLAAMVLVSPAVLLMTTTAPF